VHPVSLCIAPDTRVPDLPAVGDDSRDMLSAILVDVFARLDRLHGRPLPYMMWLNQAPRSEHRDSAWFNIEVVSPWRAPGVQRYVAAAEVATWEYFNPVPPEDTAAALRALA
jgi:UDPglucose--hexose-1-phosphate uridylyltransferase